MAINKPSQYLCDCCGKAIDKLVEVVPGGVSVCPRCGHSYPPDVKLREI